MIGWYKAKRAEWALRATAATMERDLLEANDYYIRKYTEWDKQFGWGSGANAKLNLDPQEHTNLQNEAYIQYRTNPWARAVVRSFKKYIFGPGFSVLIGDRQKKGTGINPIQKRWNEWALKTRFQQHVGEIGVRVFRDGEIFDMRNVLDGKPDYCFVRPGLLVDPKGGHTFGIETDPRDVRKAVNYFVVQEGDSSSLLNGAPIPVERMLHIKIGVDSEIKRGRTILEPVMWLLPQIPQIMQNRLKLHEIRTAIALVKRVKGGPTQMRALESSQRKEVGNVEDTTRQKAFKPGTVMYATEGVDYEFSTPNLGAVDASADLRFFLLALCAGVDLAEFMVTADSSNANYASTLVAESPAVKSIEDWQSFFDDELENEIYWQLSILENRDEDSLRADVPVDVQWPPIVHRNWSEEAKSFAILRGTSPKPTVSMETMRSRLGFDHVEEEERIEAEEAAEDAENEDEGPVVTPPLPGDDKDSDEEPMLDKDGKPVIGEDGEPLMKKKAPMPPGMKKGDKGQ